MNPRLKSLKKLPGLSLAAMLLACAAPRAAMAADDAAGMEFFEKKIRPVLIDHCYKCHSADGEKIKGGLKLDTREAVLKGGDTGPSIVPHDPDKSLLIKAVRYGDENLQMPPKKALAKEQIADLEAWVKMGAPDPRVGKVAVKPAEDKAATHWAFQPVRLPVIPEPRNQRWVRTPVDAFILKQLESKGLAPSRAADRRTLIRRATFDLIGMPPTAAEVDAFVADKSPDAWEKLVDRLLESPHYGERWGRYWLDVARYADTKGYVFEEERRYPYSYTYRDYVIRALNEDLPINRFLVEQMAADQLELGDDKRPLAALGFLTLGRRFLNNQADIIDDRIDVVARGTMGLTVVCARCHDHKFDPISTKDYYSLYGVFSSSSEPAEKPLLGKNSEPKEYPQYLEEHRKRQEEHDSFKSQKEEEALTQVRERTGDYLMAVYDTAHLEDKSKGEALARERKLDPGMVHRWADKLSQWSNASNQIFSVWHRYAELDPAKFTAEAEKVTLIPSTTHPLVAATFAAGRPASMKEVGEKYGKLFAETVKRWQGAQAAARTNAAGAKPVLLAALPEPEWESLRQVLYADDSPASLPVGEITRLFDVPTAQKARALKRKLEELDATHAGAPPRAMVLQDNATPQNSRVFIRGNPGNPGPEVPRQFLRVVAGEKQAPFKKGSGRLEMAEAIASPENPLTARVFVNRIWLHHFGAGLVRTPSDFGLRCDPPTHPELLDYLAARFMEEGWSLKKLHRWMMLSSTYQQSCEDNAKYALVDANNQLLWRMNRQRLDFESMRDSLLKVSGALDETIGGKPVEITAEPSPTRRTVYGFVERQNLPGLFRTFDFASPDTTSAQRFSTTVPQQALFMINSPFVVGQARRLAGESMAEKGGSGEAAIRNLYRRLYQREATKDEVALGVRFLQSQADLPQSEAEKPAWQYGYGGYDEAGKAVEFTPLPRFVGEAWQGGDKLPDPKLGWVMLNAGGGHPGGDAKHASIRRWTAPRDVTVSIQGNLGHDADAGDGVEGIIVQSGKGAMGRWVVKKSKQETKLEAVQLKKGETLDFVVHCRTSENSDSFTWAPVIKASSSLVADGVGSAYEWRAKADFSGPKEAPKPLSPWERYVQALMISNEFAFVD